MGKKKETEKMFRTMEEIRRKYFPDAYKKENQEKKAKEPATYGTGLAMEIFKNIKRDISEK